jgi:hypothetical protein
MERVMAAYEAGQVDVSGAILDAAVHAWYEGHIQGEAACPGCNYRGQLPKQTGFLTDPPETRHRRVGLGALVSLHRQVILAAMT